MNSSNKDGDLFGPSTSDTVDTMDIMDDRDNLDDLFDFSTFDTVDTTDATNSSDNQDDFSVPSTTDTVDTMESYDKYDNLFETNIQDTASMFSQEAPLDEITTGVTASSNSASSQQQPGFVEQQHSLDSFPAYHHEDSVQQEVPPYQHEQSNTAVGSTAIDSGPLSMTIDSSLTTSSDPSTWSEMHNPTDVATTMEQGFQADSLNTDYYGSAANMFPAPDNVANQGNHVAWWEGNIVDFDVVANSDAVANSDVVANSDAVAGFSVPDHVSQVNDTPHGEANIADPAGVPDPDAVPDSGMPEVDGNPGPSHAHETDGPGHANESSMHNTADTNMGLQPSSTSSMNTMAYSNANAQHSDAGNISLVSTNSNNVQQSIASSSIAAPIPVTPRQALGTNGYGPIEMPEHKEAVEPLSHDQRLPEGALWMFDPEYPGIRWRLARKAQVFINARVFEPLNDDQLPIVPPPEVHLELGTMTISLTLRYRRREALAGRVDQNQLLVPAQLIPETRFLRKYPAGVGILGRAAMIVVEPLPRRYDLMDRIRKTEAQLYNAQARAINLKRELHRQAQYVRHIKQDLAPRQLEWIARAEGAEKSMRCRQAKAQLTEIWGQVEGVAAVVGCEWQKNQVEVRCLVADLNHFSVLVAKHGLRPQFDPEQLMVQQMELLVNIDRGMMPDL